MSSRVAPVRALLPKLASALRDFTSSPSTFRIVHSVRPTGSVQPPKTLYILDSSFNPPSVAHMSLATSALNRHDSKTTQPCYLLLLFSTHNADKAPSPASFEHRLAMMTLFAEDLQSAIQRTANQSPSPREDISIDIGLTKAPYYTDKTAAISTAQPNPYPSKPIHVHLIGFDTVTRLLASKYYPDHQPPLSALSPYFEGGHKFLVTIRPSDPNDASSATYGTADQQINYIDGLVQGSLEEEGFKRNWAGQVDRLIGQEGIGVSSTRIRKAARGQDWYELQKLCTPGVAAWVKEMGLYGQNPKTE